MQAVKTWHGTGSTGRFPIKGTLDELRADLATLGFPVDPSDDLDDEVRVTPFASGNTPDGRAEMAMVHISAILDHEEDSQPITDPPRDVLDILARHVCDGHVVVLDESTFKGNTARRWAVDARGERVSIDLVDLETQIVERLDCSARVPDLD